MLIELHIRDFAIIEELRIGFEPGLNVLTGETGAGKSIIIDALGAVLGERVGPDVVRSGAKAAHVEAIFDVEALADHSGLAAFAAEFGLELDEGTLILAREVASGGRSTARINGRATTAGALARAGALLVDIHGQSDHLSLLRQSEHIEVLDRFAGTLSARAEIGELVRELRDVRASLEALISGERERGRRVDLLSFQVAEIEDANLIAGEDEQLATERDVLSNAERLIEEASAAYAQLAGGEFDDEGGGALSALRTAAPLLDAIAAVDGSMAPVADRLREVAFLIEDVITETREYRDRIEADPVRLEAVEERLELIKRLKRKYGNTIEEVVAYGRESAAELSNLTGGEMNAAALHARESELLSKIGHAATVLSARRKAAADRLVQGVEATISELNMGRARFAVQMSVREIPNGAPVYIDGVKRHVAFDETGVDRIEFMLAANAGEALKPLARVASGGEMARLMLALKSIIAVADESSTLVFDEVDVGVGGRSGQIVGEKLWGLTASHQVIVITHLAQIAAFAESHYRITKGERDGRTTSEIVLVTGKERLNELAAMLDGLPPSDASRDAAREMLQRIAAVKSASGLPVAV